MNLILENKYEELNNAKDYEAWYLVKQTTDFCNLCYLVSFLKGFKEKSSKLKLQYYIEEMIKELKNSKPEIKIENNYRDLRVAAFFGLIKMTSSNYKDSIVSETYNEILSKCNGVFEKTELYDDIICRQIEKIFISSDIDEENTGVRKDYRLYPIMLLYKILVELGINTGNARISIDEYRYFVATTKKFEDFLDTLLFIKLSREETDCMARFSTFRKKFDNRMNKAIEQLNTLNVTNDYIEIKQEKFEEVSKKVFLFESHLDLIDLNNYIDFLCSKKSLFDFEKKFIDESKRVHTGVNTILYGVPGSGKSYTIKHEYAMKSVMERVVFHPDYTYSDFVGQILPKSVNGNVSYEFTPGPFTKIVRDAYRNPEKEYMLVIEEISRGNAPAIFGDIFQLLDRDKECQSEYEITNEDMAKIIYDDGNHKIRIPSNLSLIGTMNTSDQNVFTLDTAFQRRWNMRLIENSFKKETKEEIEFAEKKILDSSITWEKFCNGINNLILEKNQNMTSSEDKRLGTHFVNEHDLEYTITTIDKDGKKHETINARKFPEKVLKYLWDDAFKFYRDEIFKDEYNSLEKVFKEFLKKENDNRFDVFKDNVIDSLTETTNKSGSSN